MHADQQSTESKTPIRLTVRTATRSDVTASIRAGIQDLKLRPALSLVFGLVYALFGVALIAGLANFDQIWILVAVAVGFPLVAPFLAAGLYEMSRRHSSGTPFSATDIFLVIFNQQRRQFGWMSFLVLFIFWIWAYQVRIILALTMHYQQSRSLDHFLESLLTTSGGMTFLIIGSIVGAILATVLFSLTVVAMPLLLHKDVDVVTAMITSVKSVLQSPVVMLGWGATIGAMTFAAMLPAFLGVIVLFPIIGHASWHLYGLLVSEDALV
jgi:uncharacterized membrane protein